MSELNTMDVRTALSVLQEAAKQSGYNINITEAWVTLYDLSSEDEISTSLTNTAIIIEKRADLENFIRGL